MNCDPCPSTLETLNKVPKWSAKEERGKCTSKPQPPRLSPLGQGAQGPPVGAELHLPPAQDLEN